jgi:hypothetical protein
MNEETVLFTSVLNSKCFNEGTKILTLNKNFEEEYVCIEKLRKGDIVKSYKHGYRKIDLIGKNPMFNNPDFFGDCMYIMKKNTDNDLIEDLIVTGGHSILVNELTHDEKIKCEQIFSKTLVIDDKYLLNCSVSNDFEKINNKDLYIYFHLTLENNGDNDERFGIWANGILTETPSKNQFINNKYTLL